MVTRKKVNKKIDKTSKNSSMNRKDFEAFKFGVQRLKELKEEFDSLDTRGFSKEAQRIRSKLNNVSEIPNIERELRELKLKINKKYRPQKKRRNFIKRDIEDIKEDIPELKEEIKKLSKRVGTSRKKETSIDSGVGNLVDVEFNTFLSDVKNSLSGRIRNREKEIDDTLKIDLQKRDQKFRNKYADLVREFNKKQRESEETLNKKQRESEEKQKRSEEAFDKKQKRSEEILNKKYATKVKVSLSKEISEKFNEKLNEKLNSEKVALAKEYKASLKAHAQESLAKQKEDMIEKLQKDREKFNLYKEEEREKMHDKLVDEFHKKLESELTRKEKIIKSQIQNNYDLKLKAQLQEHEANMKKKKIDLEIEMQKKIKQILVN